MSTDDKVCVRCHKPVRNAGNLGLFEGMHWICFHFSFEHINADPDDPCEDPSCPWVRIQELESKISADSAYTSVIHEKMRGVE